MSGKSRHTGRAIVISALTVTILLMFGAGKEAEGGQDNRAPLPRFLGDSRSINVASSIGAVSDSLPIVVPPGRHSIEPRLTLSYSSMGGQGKLGLGWDIEIGRVERWRGDGVPPAPSIDTDRFTYSLGGAGGELRHAGIGVYRAKTESIYREFRRLGEGWEMRDGEGNFHRFGGTDESRTGEQVWLLDLVRDRNGNTIQVSYVRLQGALYPREIRYTGHEPTHQQGRNVVLFEYEDRPDHRISYIDSARQELNQRLRRLSVLEGDNLVRRYEFSYVQSPVNGQTLLQRITLVGADDASRIVLRELSYGSRPLAPGGADVTTGLPVDLAVYDADAQGSVESGARFMDVNGDGFADALDNGTTVWLGDGQGRFTLNEAWSESLQAANVQFAGDDGADNGIRLMDVNGDMRADLFIATPSRREIRLNTGAGWTRDDQWTASLESLALQAIAFTDQAFLNTPQDCSPPHCDWLPQPIGTCIVPPDCTGSDDDPDDCVTHCSVEELEGCLPDHCTVADYELATQEVFALVDVDNDSKGIQLADVNGDGRIDILWSMTRDEVLYWMTNRAPVRVRGVFLNTGSGWIRSDPLTDALAAFNGEFVTDTRLQGYDVLDVNGDGLADIVRTMEGQSLEVFLSTGRGWEKDAVYSASLQANTITSLSSDRKGLGLMPVDFDDDGLLDYLKTNGTTTVAYQNTGSGWVISQEMTDFLIDRAPSGLLFNTSDGKATGVALADVDGDGVSDFVVARNDQGAPTGESPRWVSRSAQIRSGSLVKAVSGAGEVTEISWGVTTQLDNRREDGVQGLPSPMVVATMLTRQDGRSHSWASTLEYGGGLMEDRQFRGFAWSRESLPSGLRTVRRYHQTEGLSGQFYREEGVGSEGVVRVRRSISYEQVAATPGITQSFARQIDEETIDPGATHRTRVVNQCDRYLNRVSVWRDPDLDTPGDETTTQFLWAMNEEAGIWSLPAGTRVLLPDGAVASENAMIYDGLPLGTAGRGLLSEVRDLVEPGVTVSKFMEYDAYGNMVRLTDRSGQGSEFGYGDASAAFRTWARDPEGRELHCTYDPRFGLPLVDQDAAGNLTLKTYDVFGRITEERLPGDEGSPNGTRTWTYSPLGNGAAQFFVTAETESPGLPDVLETKSYFDGFGLIYRVEREGPSGAPVVTTTIYDDASNVVATSRPFFADEVPNYTLIRRDPLHRPVHIEEPDGIGMGLSYAGMSTTMLDRRGATSTFRKNGDGQLTEIAQVVNGAEQVTRYVYDPLGRLVSTVDAVGSETRMTYDALGRRVRLEDPNAGTYRYAYDGEGRIVSQIGPDGKETAFVYNRAGDLIRKEFPDGTYVEFSYGQPGEGHGAGRIVRIRDAAGVVEIAYDPRGNVVERKRALADDAHLGPARGRLLPRTYVTGYSYDSLGRIRRITYPDGFTANYEYDGAGNLARVTDGTGDLIAGLDAYTSAGQLGAVKYGNGVTSTFQYNPLQQMTNILTRTGEGVGLQDLEYTYDPGGNILSIANRTDNDHQTFEYDAAGRLIGARGAYGEESYEYDAIGNLVRKGRMHFIVDPDHPQRVIRQSTTSSKGRFLRRREQKLAYDDHGNVIRKGKFRYEYDSENHLVCARSSGGNVRTVNTYDSAGQRVVQRSNDGVTVYIDGIYEEGRRLATRHVMAGQMLVASRATPLSSVRLIEEAPPPLLASGAPWLRWMSCMPKGILHSLPITGAVLCVWLILRCLVRSGIWDRGRSFLVELGNRMRCIPIRGSVILTLVPVLLMVSSQAVQGEIRLHSGTKGPQAAQEQWYYYHSNHLGSVHVVTDGDSNVVARRNYRPYGEPFEWSGHVKGPKELLLTFDGQRYDDEEQLYYFNARHYDPVMGRFLASDTKVPDPTDPRSLHRYAFAAGNPIRYVDPTGHGFWDWFVAIFVIVIAAVIAVVTFGAGLALGFACLGGILLMTVGAAFAGGVVFASLALSRGTDPLSADFWKAAAAGMIIGAAVGAGFACLPSTFAAFGSLPSGFMGLLGSLGANAMVGAAFGAVQETIVHFKNGGGPEGLMTAKLGIAIGISAAISMASTGAMKALKLVKAIAKVVTGIGYLMKAGAAGGLVHAGFTGKTVMQSLGEGIEAGMQAFINLTIYGIAHNAASPGRSPGIPVWAFAGATLGGGGGAGDSEMSAIFATMPLAH